MGIFPREQPTITTVLLRFPEKRKPRPARSSLSRGPLQWTLQAHHRWRSPHPFLACDGLLFWNADMYICIPYLDPRRVTGGFTTEKGGNVMSALGRVMFPNVRAGGWRFPSVFCVYICTILNPGRRQPKHLWGLALCLCACLHFPLL
jgi:hypothetical protein